MALVSTLRTPFPSKLHVICGLWIARPFWKRKLEGYGDGVPVLASDRPCSDYLWLDSMRLSTCSVWLLFFFSLQEHYKDLSSKPFYPKLVDYIISGPVVAMVRYVSLPLRDVPYVHVLYVISGPGAAMARCVSMALRGSPPDLFSMYCTLYCTVLERSVYSLQGRFDMCTVSWHVLY